MAHACLWHGWRHPRNRLLSRDSVCSKFPKSLLQRLPCLCSKCLHDCSAAASVASLQQTVLLPCVKPQAGGQTPSFCPADAYTDLAGNTGSASIDSVVSTGTATTESSSSSASSGAASLGNGAIIGIAIGGFFFLVLLVVLFLVVSCSVVSAATAAALQLPKTLSELVRGAYKPCPCRSWRLYVSCTR